MWNPESYTIAALLFPRMLGFIYFCAIGAFLFQIRGLLGKNGILPVRDYLNIFRLHFPRRRFFYIPSLFLINSSDRALMGLTILGTLISIVLMLGYYPVLCLAMLFVIHL